MEQRRNDERGIALIMVLLVVTLLTILVIEFTYTVEVESHISRNSLNALQATYLARSGINILAGALLQDEDQKVDPGEKDPWRFFALGPCQNILSNETWVPPNWNLCGRIVDESSKLNINLSRPSAPPVNPNTPNTPNAPNASTDCARTTAGIPYCWRDALAELAAQQGMNKDDLKATLDSYWSRPPQSAGFGQPAVPVPDFNSLEDVASQIPLLSDRTIYDQVSRVATAIPLGRNARNAKLNINMVKPEVLSAILTALGESTDGVGDIVARRKDKPFESVGEALSGVSNLAGLAQMFGTTSNLFRLEASASVNGVGKTVRALVLREQAPPPKNAPQGVPGWRLTYIEWQKESGVGASRETGDDDGSGLDADGNSDKNLS